MNSTTKHHPVATTRDFIGTTMFLFFAFAGTQVANVGAKESTDNDTTTTVSTRFSPIILLCISLCFCSSFMVYVWVFFRISGGLFNPAVTLALPLAGPISKFRAVCLFLSQIVAGIAASSLLVLFFSTPFKVQMTLNSTTFIQRGLLIEALLTAELVLISLMLAKERHRATFLAPVGIGLTLFIAPLVGILYTRGPLLSARSFSPWVVTSQFGKEHWIYWVEPLIDIFIALAFYKFIKVSGYELVNPDQDADNWNSPTKTLKGDADAVERSLVTV
ncbi:aquaporin-1 [Viridothelium virens]|uniref:Aquaporin-1 n=1 Tax=Viridothelium virens TaxID=1048519 RepID=A0A6A6H4U4_VIRVR|nr:aquaporin-1 [Viridothelium virens]